MAQTEKLREEEEEFKYSVTRVNQNITSQVIVLLSNGVVFFFWSKAFFQSFST